MQNDAALQKLIMAILAQSGEAPQEAAGFSSMPPGTQYLLPDGRKPALRSEGTEYERARRTTPPPVSILQDLLAPEQSAFQDALRRRQFGIMNSTGYDYYNQPGK